MSDPASPKAWANFLVRAWGPNFPVQVRTIALDYSKRFADPILKIAEAEVSNFEGAIYFRPKKEEKPDRWFILYNPSIESIGRRNFTIAHEFGHYLNHRSLIRRTKDASLECSQKSVLGIDSDAAKIIEREADEFASYLLMPMNDFRQQIAGQPMNVDLLSHCVDRYEVSWTAAASKWIEFTEERAVLVVAIDGFVLWSRRSTAAEKSYMFFKRGMPLPDLSVAAKGPSVENLSLGTELPGGIWHREPVREITIFADKYDLTISLLIFNRHPQYAPLEDAEPDADLVDIMEKRQA